MSSILPIEDLLTQLEQQSITSKDSDTSIALLVEMLRQSMTPMKRVEIARNPNRPHIEMVEKTLFKNFVELHGDRRFLDDTAIYGGIGNFHGQPCMLIGHHKGVDGPDRVRRQFGMPHPEGYRKALRLAKLAEKFHIPILFVVDTPGAHSDYESEMRGQGMAIAENIFTLSGVKTPMIALILGEGSSGGALAIAVADRILMLENSVYSVISPESCASILWRSREQKELAAEQLHLDAPFLFQSGIVHEVIREPFGCAHLAPQKTVATIEEALLRHLAELKTLSLEELLQQRYTFFRKIGEVESCSN